MSRLTALILSALLVLGVACASDSSDSESGTETVAYKAAVVGGDAGDQAAFQDAIDCIMASGIEGAETEERVGDTLVRVLGVGRKPDSLLEWAQTLCTA